MQHRVISHRSVEAHANLHLHLSPIDLSFRLKPVLQGRVFGVNGQQRVCNTVQDSTDSTVQHSYARGTFKCASLGVQQLRVAYALGHTGSRSYKV